MDLRVGQGWDIHRLRAGGVLRLAGVEVSRELSPEAHSDGDVVLHAVVDALLGALGWGDIGEWFADADPRWKDAPSRAFVEAVRRRMAQEGWSVVNVDVTILAERPRLKDFKEAMRRSLAELTGGAASVKAGTNEGMDAVGRGEAIAAHAVALVARE